MKWLTFPLLCLLVSCRQPAKPLPFADLTAEFVYATLALSPPAATAAGYHQHRGILLDERLEDWTPGGAAARLAHWRQWEERLREWEEDPLENEERADLQLMRRVTALALFELERARSHESQPAMYVESLGQALFAPWTLEYAPLAERWQHLEARLQAAPAFLQAARSQT